MLFLGPVELEVAWTADTFECLARSEFNPLLQILGQQLRDEISAARDEGMTTIPVATPIIAGEKVIFRTAVNLRAVDRRSGEVVWDTFNADRKMDAVRESWVRDGETSPLQLMMIRPQLQNHWLRANLSGQLACDSRTVFTIDETSEETMRLNLDDQVQPLPKPTNYLRAYDVQTGMLRGQAGGPIGTSVDGGQVNPLTGMYFLGAPLVMGDRIYVIAESDQGIYLLQLRATPIYAGDNSERDMRPVRSQLLSIPRHPIRSHPVRKYAGIIPSYGRGLLICNTCDEQVIAISAEDHSVRWIYRYPTNVAIPEMNPSIATLGSTIDSQESDRSDLNSRWTDCLPRIVGDRIIGTPRDTDRLFCLDLKTGREIWSRPRGSSRSVVAVTEDKVVLTGNGAAACMKLQDGEQLWTTQIRNGRVTGYGVSNGQTLHVPTSAPSIVSLDIRTGRTLLERTVEAMPGNLLSIGDRLVSQSITQVSCLSSGAENDASAAFVSASEKLLKGDVATGEASLRLVIAGDDSSEAGRARRMLIDSTMESLRLDYPANVNRIAELQALIDEESPEQQDIENAGHAMMGMTLADAVLLPGTMSRINQSEGLRIELQALVERGQLQDRNLPPQALSAVMLKMLDTAILARDSRVKTDDVTNQRGHLRTAAVIREAVALRSSEVAQEVDTLVTAGLQQRVTAAGTDDEKLARLESFILTGLGTSASQSVAIDVEPSEKFRSSAMQDLLALQRIDEADQPLAATLVDQLLTDWVKQERWLAVADVLDSGMSTDEQFVVEHRPARSLTRDGVLPVDISKQKRDELSALIAPHLPTHPWVGSPVVSESPARSSLAVVSGDNGAVRADIPLFGTAGRFGGWFFQQNIRDGQVVHAFDSAGRPRWSFDPGDLPIRRTDNFSSPYSAVTTRYAVACGNLLAMKLDQMLYVFDCGAASAEKSPTLLWDVRLEGFVSPALRNQIFSRGWERTTQYDMQPSGLFPVGPLTPFGIPIYSGRELAMLNTFTGVLEWRVGGLPSDCKLTATDHDLLLISESTGQVEVRNLIDGSVRSVVALPSWWTDASENSNASVHTFQPEPGEDLRWRIAVQRGGCLLLRRNTEEAALERYDLKAGEIDFSIPLPADSLVSNIINGHVAVLSNGNQLQIYDLVSGVRKADIEVPDAPEGMYLYLRCSGGQWVVITDIFGDDHDEQNPAGEAVIVHGRIYSVNQSERTLSWSAEIDYEWLRVLRPSRGLIPPTAPFLVLLKRPFTTVEGPNGLRRGPVLFQARIWDVRTGEILYQDKDVGRTLNFLWTRLDAANWKIELSFDKRVLTFDYSGEERAPAAEDAE